MRYHIFKDSKNAGENTGLYNFVVYLIERIATQAQQISELQNKPKCPDCNSVHMSHCSILRTAAVYIGPIICIAG